MSNLYEAAAAPTLGVANALTDDQLAVATPCTEYTVRDVLNHLYQVTGFFADLGRGVEGDFTAEPDLIVGEWRRGLSDATASLSRAWSAEGSLEGPDTSFGMPRAMAANVAISELLVHGWDVAVACGLPYEPSSAVVDYVWGFQSHGNPHTEGPPGLFGPPVAADEDAPRLDRLIAHLGRDPRWKP
ncbi:MAG TPA: TIGR03086 family metal-binding protein [Stackebrandtia sp.]|uniref:TIGR03086 family metal-binding protein n=1 Tax=Stackebrandtia sp. TaxID=2023065 RepID=UPI002D3C96BE|nr:TIGR03086 family metal-binding protein [Stackebrandtia sp.]HZE41896.1 TIGR03086 family metal-binding protein [Stackebrandtia sp.]